VIVAILSLISLYGGNRKTKLSLLHNTRIHAPEGHFGNSRRCTIGRRLQLAYPRCKPCDPDACPSLRSLSTRSDPVYVCRASSLGFVAQPRNPDSFVVNHRKPRRLGAASTPIPLMTWPPRHPGSTLGLRLNKETLPDFVLLFQPPCGLQMISFAHRVH
jgi:hypothetical protein